MSGARVLGVAAAAAVVQLAPALTSVAPLRRAALPRLAGIGGRRHIALTYDDGPDPVSTPAFLGLLDAYDGRATFFLLGAHVEENRSLVREMAAAGHELAVHGWDHRCLAWKRPGRLADELRRTRDLVAEIVGRSVRWYRPPYGVLTAEGLLAARRAGLTTVLWSAWGRDWSARATPAGVVHRVGRAVGPGGTVLLHDTDRTSAPQSWLVTLEASDVLLDGWLAEGTPVGTLGEHVMP
ncbi:MAG: polysaccharide deacetylase family protein [Nocardioidaceae bacterium]